MDTIDCDVAIVGSGIACASTLCEFAVRLKVAHAGGKALRIVIIEREGEMWNGIPYGKRSAYGALAFQRLQEFLEEPERSSYIRWLIRNADWWLRTFRQCGGRSAERWIADNASLIEQNNWGELYLPRFLFGLYISREADRALEELETAGLATVTRIHGEATQICRKPNSCHVIEIERESGARISVEAERVVLAIGSPPQKSIHDGAVAGAQYHTHIDDIYTPSEDFSIHKIQQALSSLPDKKMANVLVVGSNASSLEMLYLITYRPEIRNLINSVVVLSRSGLLPYKICQDPIQFNLTALDSLAESGVFLAADVMAALAFDLERAAELGLNIADLRDSVNAAVSRLTGLLHVSEQKRFVCEHGIHYSRMMRRAGRDTRNAADDLVNAGILSVVKGEFRRFATSSSGEGLISAVYSNAKGKAEFTHPVAFSITINCGGFEELNKSSSRLITSVVESGLCLVNSTNRGFLVNEQLEASKHIYVIGPLLAGNFNDRVRLWHVESASRIASLAKILAESLHQSLFTHTDYAFSNAAVLSSEEVKQAAD